jgi:hypothetical protein
MSSSSVIGVTCVVGAKGIVKGVLGVLEDVCDILSTAVGMEAQSNCSAECCPPYSVVYYTNNLVL